MKYTVTFFLAAVCFLHSNAQTGTGQAAKSAVACKDLKDSASYAFGYSIGQRYPGMDPNIIAAAIKDAYANKTAAVDVNAGQMVVQNFISKEAKKKVDANKIAGQQFLAANAKKPGIKTTASGLQYEVIKMGTGEKPKATSMVKVIYSGSLLNGKVFDASERHGGTAQFGLNQVITGWTEGVQLMPVGSKFRFFIPSNLAYGDNDTGADIKGGSTLVFEIELLEIIQ